MSGATDVSLRWATPTDHAALLALFERAFGAQMPAPLWAWKYPTGSQQSLLAEQENGVVAHYGGVPRRMVGMGHTLHCLQISDIMVDPKARGVLTRNGVFSQIANAFTDALAAPNGPYAFVYGFPAPRASRLGEMLGMYAPLDTLLQLTWPAQRSTSCGGVQRRCVSLPLAELCKVGDTLWAKQQPLSEQLLMTIRDQQWLESRYLRHPLHTYGALVYRSKWRRKPVAGVVYRAHADALEVVDLLGSPEGYKPLVEALCHQAATLNIASVFGWATPAVAEQLPSPIERKRVLPVNMAGGEKARWQACFQDNSWLTAGDTDYR